MRTGALPNECRRSKWLALTPDPTAVELGYRVWKAQPRRGLNVNSRGCNPRNNGRNRYRPRRGRTTHSYKSIRPLRGRNPFFVPIRGLYPRLFKFIPAGDVKRCPNA